MTKPIGNGNSKGAHKSARTAGYREVPRIIEVQGTKHHGQQIVTAAPEKKK